MRVIQRVHEERKVMTVDMEGKCEIIHITALAREGLVNFAYQGRKVPETIMTGEGNWTY